VRSVSALLAICLASVWWSAAWGQSATSGALSGTVKDARNAPIVGVAVTLTNRATNQAHSATTDSNGRYQFSLLPPGGYEVKFSVAGFKTSAMESATVSVSEAPSLDAVLEPGEHSERVVCKCQLSASTSSSGTLVDGKTITTVPLTTRNFTNVLAMASGSAAGVNNAGSLGRGTSSVNVNGNTSSGGYTLDGANSPSAVPNPDTIAEFKIQTSQYDAGYGAQVPSTSLVTKSGENEFHGDGWEFVRNDIFNANAFFRNATGQSKPDLKQNQFGATLGGPVRKNRFFFFVSYQGTRQVNGLDPTSTSNPILPPLTADRSATALAAQFCPANHPNDSRYLSFAGGKQLDCNNQATATTAPINPAALRLLQMKNPDGSYSIPVPQILLTSGGNAGLGFSTFSLPSTYREGQYLVNGDYALSGKNLLSGRYYGANFDQYRSFSSPSGYPGAPILPGDGTPQQLEGGDPVATVKLTSVLSPRKVNEARMSFTRNRMDAWGVDTPSAASIGMTPGNPFFPQPPEINVLGPLGSFRLFGNIGNDFNTVTDTYSWSDNVSWVRGKHTVRTGVAMVTQQLSREDTGSARGKITFQTFSDFLLGLSAADNRSPAGRSNIESIQTNQGIGPHGEVQYTYRGWYGSGFVQDDYKAASRLTLNLGLRWEYLVPAADTQGTLGNVWPSLLEQMPIPPLSGTLIGNTVASNYDANLVNPYTGKPFGAAPAGVTVRPGATAYANNPPLSAFAPRLGFAWQPLGAQGRLVVRGGYGWFHQAAPISGTTNGTPSSSAPPFAQAFNNADSSNGSSSFIKPFPDATLGWVLRTPTSQLSDKVIGPDFAIPRLQQWNVSAQARLTRTLSLDIGYVGSRGAHLLASRGLNQPLLATPANPVNCGYDGVAADCITASTALNAGLRAPIMGETPTALTTTEYDGASSYNSLQATLRRRLSRGLSFQTAYTLSRSESATSMYNDQTKPSFDWGRSSFDRTHRLSANFDYSLPSPGGLGKRPGLLLQGWSVSGIVVVQSGPPLTLTDPSGGRVYGGAGVSTATLYPGASARSLATSGSIESRLNGWIDTSAIRSAPAIGADGSTGYGNTGIGIIDAPGQFNADLSIIKTTVAGGIREAAILVFRVEMYNALNHPQFAAPGTTLGTATFGAITQTSVAPRMIQFGLKYLF
jgi:hypothetical protein